MRVRKSMNVTIALGFVVALAVLHLRCHQALLTAPAGSSLQLFANPTFIPANGGVSVVSALILAPTGSPVNDGTVVQFFTSLGRIDEQGRTNDGVARVNLISDGRSGTAHVTAVSGGGVTGGGGGSTSTVTSTTTPVSVAAQPGASAAGIALQDDVSASLDIKIGSSLPSKIICTAFPAVLSDRRASNITCNVFDADGNPVANVPIIFSVRVSTTGGGTGTLEEEMDSQGTPTFTDNNGQAKDVMRTHAPFDEPEKTVTVVAQGPGTVDNGTVDIVINPGVSTSAPGAGITAKRH